ncbi:MAG: hypothetical protein ABI165_18620 [Bryobacteraceae bacterium]
MTGFTTLTLTLVLSLLLSACSFHDRDNDNPSPAAKPASVMRNAQGESVLTLDAGLQARAGLQTTPAAAAHRAGEILAYGQLEEDPAASFVVRAPVAGTLAANPAHTWPEIGAHIEAGTSVGAIQPRFSPSERLGLTSQLAAARADLDAATAAETVAEAAYQRARTLNEDNKNVSDQVVQEAESRSKSAQARVASLRQTAALLESALHHQGAASLEPLTTARAGDVVEILAAPGESVEAGVPLLRLTRLDMLLARVDSLPGDSVPSSVREANIVPAGSENLPPLRATRLAVAPSADPHAPGTPLLFRLTTTRFGIRPGVSVTAHVLLPGAGTAGVLIPFDAIVRYQGRTWAYVQTGADQFTRREVSTGAPVTGGYFAGSGFQPGGKLVVRGAQALLSEEFRSVLPSEDEGN